MLKISSWVSKYVRQSLSYYWGGSVIASTIYGLKLWADYEGSSAIDAKNQRNDMINLNNVNKTGYEYITEITEKRPQGLDFCVSERIFGGPNSDDLADLTYTCKKYCEKIHELSVDARHDGKGQKAGVGICGGLGVLLEILVTACCLINVFKNPHEWPEPLEFEIRELVKNNPGYTVDSTKEQIKAFLREMQADTENKPERPSASFV